MRFNSSILPKYSECIDCTDGIKKAVTAGRCGYHYRKHLQLKSYEKAKQKEQHFSPYVLNVINNIAEKELQEWFKDRRKEMTGTCLLCGGKTEKHNDKTFKRSIAHLLPKRGNQFPSISTHKNNWIELCFYGNSCHTNLDNSMISFEDLKRQYPYGWSVVVKKFLSVYPQIDAREVKNIPDILMAELENQILMRII